MKRSSQRCGPRIGQLGLMLSFASAIVTALSAQQPSAYAASGLIVGGQNVPGCTNQPPFSVTQPITASVGCSYSGGLFSASASATPGGAIGSIAQSSATKVLLQAGQQIFTYANAYRNDWFLFNPNTLRPASMTVFAQLDGNMNGQEIVTNDVLYQWEVSTWFDYSTGTWSDGWDGNVEVYLNPLSPIGCVKKFGATVYYPVGYQPVTAESCPIGAVIGANFSQDIPDGSYVSFTLPVTADKIFLSMLLSASVSATNLDPLDATVFTGYQQVDFSRTFQLSGVQFFDASGNDITNQVDYTTGSGEALGSGNPVATPEPATLMLLATGLVPIIGAAGARRRSRKLDNPS
jgi:hypothetical protein